VEVRLLAIIAICLLSLASVQAQTQPDADLAQFAALLQKHDDALNQHDLDGIMSVFAPSAKTVVMGTGPGERWQGKDEIRSAYAEIIKDFDKGTSTRTCDWRTGEVAGTTAWMASMCKFSDSKSGQKREYELNVSGVLRKISGKWYFQSLHYSNLTSGGGSSSGN
jgi:uncharacterized protein (TIGR02246 family)